MYKKKYIYIYISIYIYIYIERERERKKEWDRYMYTERRCKNFEEQVLLGAIGTHLQANGRMEKIICTYQEAKPSSFKFCVFYDRYDPRNDTNTQKHKLTRKTHECQLKKIISRLPGNYC